MSKYYYNKDYFETINSPDKAYWLGFLYADGGINRFYKNEILRSMTLELTLKDKEHLEKFIDCLESNVPISEKTIKLKNKQYVAYRVQINCTKMCYDLINLGCTPAKTYNIKFPNESQVPHEYMRDFLRGFFDGDGCIYTGTMNGNPHIELNITGMKNMLEDINNYLINEKVIIKIPKIYQCKNSKAYMTYYYGTNANKEILDYLYSNSNIYLERKFIKYKNFYANYNKKTIRGVYWSNYNNAYIVTITINKKRIRIGQYKNLEDAISARKEAEIEKIKIENNMPA